MEQGDTREERGKVEVGRNKWHVAVSALTQCFTKARRVRYE